MPEIALAGMRSDTARAVSIARALQPVLDLAHGLDATTPDQLAALGLMVASVVRRSTLAADPQVAIEALASFVRELLATAPPPASGPPPS